MGTSLYTYKHMMTFEPGTPGGDPDEGPQVTITVTAKFTGSEGSGEIMSFDLNPTGADIRNDWEKVSDVSYEVEVSLNDLCPAEKILEPTVHRYDFYLPIAGHGTL